MAAKSNHVILLPKATSFDTWHTVNCEKEMSASMFNIYVNGNKSRPRYECPGNVLGILV